jgi:hypothetical protein
MAVLRIKAAYTTLSGNASSITTADLNKSEMRPLTSLTRQLDPIRQPPFVFDPSDPSVIGELIGRTMLEQPRHPMTEIARFYGSGVYAIYYKGDFPAYKAIRGTERPIYIGKADPANPDADTAEEQEERLSRRLNDHVKSIRAVEEYSRENNIRGQLKLADFDCRYLVVKSAWQKTAEEYLINLFKPVWNNEMKICYGFGKHGDSSDTRSNTRSPWDTLHPGRRWALREGNTSSPKSSDMLIDEIVTYFLKS